MRYKVRRKNIYFIPSVPLKRHSPLNAFENIEGSIFTSFVVPSPVTFACSRSNSEHVKLLCRQGNQRQIYSLTLITSQCKYSSGYIESGFHNHGGLFGQRGPCMAHGWSSFSVMLISGFVEISHV